MKKLHLSLFSISWMMLEFEAVTHSDEVIVIAVALVAILDHVDEVVIEAVALVFIVVLLVVLAHIDVKS